MIDYDVRQSSRATRVSIKVTVHGVTVVIPEGASVDTDQIVKDKHDWIRQKLDEMQAVRDALPDRSFTWGATWPLFGDDRTLRRHDGDEHTYTDDAIHLAADDVRPALAQFYRETARSYYTAQATTYTQELGTSYNALRIKNQKTRWGSCSSKDNLNFNWRLIMAPRRVINYVVAHEVAHLRELSHSDAFWNLVEHLHPRYEEAKQWLDEHNHELIFTIDDV